jgi:hypothetical protein
MRFDIHEVAQRELEMMHAVYEGRSIAPPNNTVGLCTAKKASLVISNRWHAGLSTRMSCARRNRGSIAMLAQRARPSGTEAQSSSGRQTG